MRTGRKRARARGARGPVDVGLCIRVCLVLEEDAPASELLGDTSAPPPASRGDIEECGGDSPSGGSMVKIPLQSREGAAIKGGGLRGARGQLRERV